MVSIRAEWCGVNALPTLAVWRSDTTDQFVVRVFRQMLLPLLEVTSIYRYCSCYKEIQSTSSGQKKEAPKIRLRNFMYKLPG